MRYYQGDAAEYVGIQSATKSVISARQLLTMTAGWTTECNPEPAESRLVRRVLTAGRHGDPGTFAYSDIEPHLLLLAQVTGISTHRRAARAVQPAQDQQPARVRGPDRRRRQARGGEHELVPMAP